MLRVLYDQAFRRSLLRDLLILARRLRDDDPELAIGALGFSVGGKLAMQLAEEADAAACVAYSAEPAVGTTRENARARILMIYGSEDHFMIRGLQRFVKELAKRGGELDLKIYPSSGHEFFDPSDKRAYRAGPAEDAWAATVEFLKENLSVDNE